MYLRTARGTDAATHGTVTARPQHVTGATANAAAAPPRPSYTTPGDCDAVQPAAGEAPHADPDAESKTTHPVRRPRPGGQPAAASSTAVAYSSLQPHRVYGVGQKGTGTGPAAEYTALGECVKLDAVLEPFIACFSRYFATPHATYCFCFFVLCCTCCLFDAVFLLTIRCHVLSYDEVLPPGRAGGAGYAVAAEFGVIRPHPTRPGGVYDHLADRDGSGAAFAQPGHYGQLDDAGMYGTSLSRTQHDEYAALAQVARAELSRGTRPSPASASSQSGDHNPQYEVVPPTWRPVRPTRASTTGGRGRCSAGTPAMLSCRSPAHGATGLLGRTRSRSFLCEAPPIV